MSFGESGSPYSEIRDARIRINNLVGFGTESKIDFPRCPICLEHWRLTVTEDNGIKVGYCQGCGKSIPLEKTVNQETGGSMLTPKYTSKYGSTGKQHSFTISKDKKTKRKQTGSINDQLSDSDRDDIRKSTGISPN